MHFSEIATKNDPFGSPAPKPTSQLSPVPSSQKRLCKTHRTPINEGGKRLDDKDTPSAVRSEKKSLFGSFVGDDPFGTSSDQIMDPFLDKAFSCMQLEFSSVQEKEDLSALDEKSYPSCEDDDGNPNRFLVEAFEQAEEEGTMHYYDIVKKGWEKGEYAEEATRPASCAKALLYKCRENCSLYRKRGKKHCMQATGVNLHHVLRARKYWHGLPLHGRRFMLARKLREMLDANNKVRLTVHNCVVCQSTFCEFNGLADAMVSPFNARARNVPCTNEPRATYPAPTCPTACNVYTTL